MATSTNTIVNKVNPYIRVGELYKDGINEVAKQLAPKPPKFPETSSIIEEICKFLDKNKLLGNEAKFYLSQQLFVYLQYDNKY